MGRGRPTQATGNFSEQFAPTLVPADLQTLRTGGPAHGRAVDLLAHVGGERVADGKPWGSRTVTQEAH